MPIFGQIIFILMLILTLIYFGIIIYKKLKIFKKYGKTAKVIKKQNKDFTFSESLTLAKFQTLFEKEKNK